MLQFKEDQSMYVAVRHAMHRFAPFVKFSLEDAFKNYAERASDEDVRHDRYRIIERIESVTEGVLSEYKSKAEALAESTKDGSFDTPKLAVMAVQRIQLDAMTQLWESISAQFSDDDDLRSRMVEFVARAQSFNVEQFITESVGARNERMRELSEGGATLAAWATVFREEEIREKDIKGLIRERSAFDICDALVEEREEEIKDYADLGEGYPEMGDLTDKATDKSIEHYTDNFLVPRMIELVNINLVPNESSVALSASAPAVAKRSTDRIRNKVREMVLEELIGPMVTQEYNKFAALKEEGAE